MAGAIPEIKSNERTTPPPTDDGASTPATDTFHRMGAPRKCPRAHRIAICDITDPVAGLLLIPVGNPGPDFNNEARPGTNLFTNSLVALDAKTGQLKWWHQLIGPEDRDGPAAKLAGNSE